MSSNNRVLVVDDNEDIRSLGIAAFGDHGFKVGSASNGKDALHKIAQEKPQVVILDLLMSGGSGFDVCHSIKNDPALRDIIVVILSAKSDLETKIKCLDMGAEEYLVKPIEMAELVARVDRLLRLRKEWSAEPGTAEPAPKLKKKASEATTISEEFRCGESTSPTVLTAEPSPTPSDPVDSSATSTVSNASQKGGRSKYGVYRIESLAGSGSMGVVYKALDEVLERYVAVKALPKQWTDFPEVLDRFNTEAKMIAAINHPGIAQVFTFGNEEGEPYFALQWCAGGSLADLIRRDGQIELLPAIDMILQCADALMAASKKGVVHRDIKPSNIMFDENNQIKIVDFGVARIETGTKKPITSGEIVGSPAYMSPEQSRGTRTDHRADIYSLGITLYRMLYGTLPYSAETLDEWISRHANDPFPSYDDLGGKIPPGMYQIIQRMTHKNPEARYETYPDLISDLEKLRIHLYSESRLKIPRVVRMLPGPALTGKNFFDLLALIFKNQLSGVLRVSWGPLQKRFWIQHNEVVLFESPQPDEDLWAALAEKNLMKKEEIPSAAVTFEEGLNRVLFLQVCSPDDLKSTYRELMKASLLQVYYWPQFAGEFLNAEIQHDPFTRVPLGTILLEGARNRVDIEILRDAVPSDQFIVRTSRFDSILRSLNLPRAESFLASRLEGEHITLETLQLMTGFSNEQIIRFVYGLRSVGAVRYKTPGERRARPVVSSFHDSPIQKPAGLEPVAVLNVPDAQPAVFRELPQRARATATLTAAPSAIEEAEKLFKTAQQKYNKQDFWGTERLCAQAIKRVPTIAKYHHLMALALVQYPHSKSVAKESFSTAITLEPRNPEFHVDLAQFYKDRGDLESAYTECEKALEISPRHARAREIMETLEF